MSWLDRTIAYISPARAHKREAWRKAYEEIRSYDAGTDERLNAGWRAVNATSNEIDGVFRETLRSRSRDLERNSDILESIIGAFERNVVGEGFKLQATTEDEDLNDQIEDLWEEWCKPRNCDVTYQQSFSEMCRMVVRRKKVDGGIILVKRYTTDGVLPFSIQVREVDDLDTMQQGNNAKRINNGIEYNEYNRPIAYHFKKYDVSGFYSGESERIEANDVIFLWHKKRPTQIREISEMSPTLSRIRDVNSYMEAVSVKERVAACLSVFVKRQSPLAGGSIGRQNKSAVNGYEGKSLTPGMIMELNPGDDVSVVTPPAQGSSASDFVRLQQRLAGSGQGISYESAARDMSQVNYSSARQGLLEDQKTYAIEQQFLIDHMLTEIYETFLISAVLSGAVNVPDFWNNKRKYMDHEWTPPGMKWIDPQKEANANKIMLETGQTTLAEVAAASGHDWKDIIDQRARELAYMKAKGVNYIDDEAEIEEKPEDES